METIGPDICGVSEQFAIISPLESTHTEADLAIGQRFTATFSEEAPWKIILKGKTSGAVKTISGTGRELDVVWNGSTDTVYFFRKEPVTTYLQIPCRTPISGPEFKITALGIPVKSGDLLISDFEDSNYWTYSFNADAPEHYYADTNKIFPPEGLQSYHWYGTDKDNNYLMGQITSKDLTSPLPSLPADKVYLNIYIKGGPGSRLDIRLFEGTGTSGPNWTAVVNVDWSGWKLVSVKLSDFDPSGNTTTSLIPDKIGKVRLMLKASKPGGHSDIYMDYLVITGNYPFQP
ncbi:MAG: hypothetical protein ACK40G_00140 [Cytophagaceae bacterium]